MTRRYRSAGPSWDSLPEIPPDTPVFVVDGPTIQAGVMVAWTDERLGMGFCRVRTGPPNSVVRYREFWKTCVTTTSDEARVLLARARERNLHELQKQLALWQRLDASQVPIADNTKPRPERTRKKKKT